MEIKDRILNKVPTEFEMDDQIVKTKSDKIWIPKENVLKFIEHTHKILCHAGVKKTSDYISQQFSFENKNDRIKEIVQSCEECQKRKTLTTPTKEIIIKHEIPTLFEVILIDFCGPLKTTVNGKRYILAIMDQFSRYISLNAVSKQDEKTTSDTIKNNWILKFGAPKEIKCDRGKTFESNVIKQLAEAHNMELLYSSAYHHSANGMIERQFRTIRDAIQISIKEKPNRNWSELLPEVEFMMNATIQSTIGFSPAEVVFGKRIYKDWVPTRQNVLTVDKYVETQVSEREDKKKL